MPQKINDDNYIVSWDWKESIDCEEINKIILENLGRMPKFFNVESGSDDYNILISYNVSITKKQAQQLFDNQQ